MFRIGDKVKIVIAHDILPAFRYVGKVAEIMEVYPQLVSDENLYLVKVENTKYYVYSSELRFSNDEAIYS